MQTNSIADAATLAKTLFERFFEDWRHLSDQDLLDYLKPKIEQAITFEELEKKLAQVRHLKIKFGIDPTGPDVHLGHVLPIMLLRQFQKAGHHIDLVIGDFTALIGDPSGQSLERPALLESEIKKNLKTYLAQIGVYINTRRIKHHRNSRWLSKRKLKDVLVDLKEINLAEVLQREDFRKRMESGQALPVAEILYSHAQSIDSLVLEPDIEVGGRDQLLNFAHTRKMMALHNQQPEVALCTPLLEGISGNGKKMSKSYNNYIAVRAPAEDKFGKIMSIPDRLIEPYYKAFTDIRASELGALYKLITDDPMETKKQLAQFLVAIEAEDLYAGQKEREKFENRFSKGVYDSDIRVITVSEGTTTTAALEQSREFKSKSEIRRLFEQGGVRMVSPEEKELSPDERVTECTIRAGKTKFFRIKLK